MPDIQQEIATAPTEYFGLPHIPFLEENQVWVGEIVNTEGPGEGSVDRLAWRDRLMAAAVTNWPTVLARREAAAREDQLANIQAATAFALARAALDTTKLIDTAGGLPAFQETIAQVPVTNPATLAVRATIGQGVSTRASSLEDTIGWFRQVLATLPDGDPDTLNLQHGMEMTARLLGAQQTDGTLQARGERSDLETMERVLAGLKRL